MYNLLIIDDDEMSLESLKKFLSSESFIVHAFISPYEAINSCKKNRYDLIASDFKLPYIDGITLINEVKKIYPNIKTILFTGYHTEMIISRSKKEKIDLFITKPIRTKKFIEAIHNLLFEKDSIQQLKNNIKTIKE